MSPQPPKALPLLEVTSGARWRAWLAKHHATQREVWLVFRKKHTGKATLSYEAAVDEALCYGWVDSLVRRIDDTRYARKFTPRKPNARWSTINRTRYAALEAAGRLAPPGRARPPTARSGDAPPASDFHSVPSELETALAANARARRTFEQLAPSYRRHYIAWIATAKRAATKDKRLREAVALLAAGQKLGLK